MTLDQLRIFVEVATREHITRTATALNMTQSAVSAAITALEGRHGVELFDRVGRSIVLNQTGRAFLKEAVAVLASARTAEGALADLAGLKRGELSVMGSQTIAGYWLPARLVRYREKFPGITLGVRVGNTVDVADAVEAGEVEIGLVEGQVERPALSVEVVATDEMIVVVAPQHPWASLAKLRSSQLPESPWVIREPGSGTRLAFENLIAREGIDRNELDIAMTLPGNEIVSGAVEAGPGAMLVSRAVVASKLKSGTLCEVAYPPTPRPFYLLRHKERYRSKAGDAFVAMIRERGK
ncbi:LysR family transcriptional regulator [Rhizobium sp. BK251]|uniref:LysR family transcriptional regulator n=1 Tax=Rhizobium sp. BK251 TaxID=2512125 RepID=UPI00104816D0|nr:LysR family transcriptional regulator [Rhizobium sp. BK251]TCL71161.1 DNA-binding transcriptional LysR family regulator [Rhizobium sp. BK251]